MYQWIEYSLFFSNGEGTQPYSVIAPFGAGFDGGYFVETGRYRGRLFGTVPQITDALAALTNFAVTSLTDAEIVAIAEQCIPINSPVYVFPNSPMEYLGPASVDADGRIVRLTSSTPYP